MSEDAENELYHIGGGRPLTVRFAPSPSGRLHLGNLRTALVNALAARRFGGTLQLRIEDTDRARADDARVADIAADLAWLGIEWTGEAPGVPFRQSARTTAHMAALEELRRRDRAYPCFCPAAELERARKRAVAMGKPPRYSGKCAALSTAEAARRVAAGEPHAMRFRLPTTGEIVFDDLARGTMRFAAEDLGDFVARRANGDFSFFFVNAVDDAALGVTCVLRGDDHLANTPRQLALLAALDLPAPRYGHLSLMTDADGGPLSKRRGAMGADELRATGFLPGALWNYLARTAGVCRERGEFLSPDELAAGFAFAHLSRSPTRHDDAQLRHWQKLAVLGLSAAECAKWLTTKKTEEEEADERFAMAVRENVLFPADAEPWRRVTTGETMEMTTTATEVIVAAGADFFRTAAGLVAAEAGTDGETAGTGGTGDGPEGTGGTGETGGVGGVGGVGGWKEFCKRVSLATGRKGRELYRPLRAGLTGRVDGPEMTALFPLLPPVRAKRRLEKAGGLAEDGSSGA